MTDVTGSSKVNPTHYESAPSFKSWAGTSLDLRLIAEFDNRLRQAREAASKETWESMLDAANKWAAVETGAIESLYESERGYTYSVAASTASWEGIAGAKGLEASRAITNQLAAYEWVLDAATSHTEISEYWIKSLHEAVCRSQSTYSVRTSLGPQERKLSLGAYKEFPNSPSSTDASVIHHYAPPMDVPIEMGRLIAQMRTSEFISASPIAQAAYAHYAFVQIHPFADGNGRVSRALASIFLYRAFGIPLVIFADQKHRYFDALEAADKGRYGEFSNFIRDSVVDTINLVVENMRRATRPDISARLSELTLLQRGRGGLSIKELEETGLRVLGLMSETLTDVINDTPLPEGVSLRSDMYVDAEPRDERYRQIPFQHRVVVLECSEPAYALSVRSLFVAIGKPHAGGADVIIYDDQGETIFPVFIHEVHPVITEQLRLRARAVIETEWSSVVDTLITRVKASLNGETIV
ncbi:Fic family protein [Clavibacter michiganensis]|uniref:Fic family protein n=1 Tax=Clavibacter michiganensis TaxID=28447 RepID=UPI003EBFF2B2